MKLRVNYKDKVVDVIYSNIYTEDNKLHVVFNNDLEDHFQFFINYLIANCIKYKTIYNNQFKTIITDANLFTLAISVINPIKSSDINDSLLEAIRDYKSKLDILKDSLVKLQKEYDYTISIINEYDTETSKFEFIGKLKQIRKDILKYELSKLLESIKLIQVELDNTRASVPNVKDLKIAFHVSEMLNEELCKKALYLREYLMNKQKLTKEEHNWLKSLKKLSEYAYEEDINEVKKMLLVMTSEYFKNAAKYVENEKNIKLQIEENLREFYR